MLQGIASNGVTTTLAAFVVLIAGFKIIGGAFQIIIGIIGLPAGQ
jgi:hypothetical protein